MNEWDPHGVLFKAAKASQAPLDTLLYSGSGVGLRAETRS